MAATHLSSGATILVFAWEMGAGAALAPVVQALCRRGHRCLVRALPPGLDLLRNRCGESVETAPWESKTCGGLVWDVALGGVGHPTWCPDGAAAWTEINRRGPTVGLMDSWKGLDRFLTPEGSLAEGLAPDRVAVMDEVSASQLHRMGFPPWALRVTGHPGLEQFMSLEPEQWTALRSETRARLGIAADVKVVLLASERLHDHKFHQRCGSGCRGIFFGRPGQDHLWEGILAEERRDTPDVVVLMRPHPNESGDRGGAVRMVTWGEADDRMMLAAADRVYGLSSMLLLQAAMLGKPVNNIRDRLDDWVPENSLMQPETWRAWGGRLGAFPGIVSDVAYHSHRGAIAAVVDLVESLLVSGMTVN